MSSFLLIFILLISIFLCFKRFVSFSKMNLSPIVYRILHFSGCSFYTWYQRCLKRLKVLSQFAHSKTSFVWSTMLLIFFSSTSSSNSRSSASFVFLIQALKLSSTSSYEFGQSVVSCIEFLLCWYSVWVSISIFYLFSKFDRFLIVEILNQEH